MYHLQCIFFRCEFLLWKLSYLGLKTTYNPPTHGDTLICRCEEMLIEKEVYSYIHVFFHRFLVKLTNSILKENRRADHQYMYMHPPLTFWLPHWKWFRHVTKFCSKVYTMKWVDKNLLTVFNVKLLVKNENNYDNQVEQIKMINIFKIAASTIFSTSLPDR